MNIASPGFACSPIRVKSRHTSIILHNVVDLTDVLTKMGSERAIITKELGGAASVLT